MQRSLMDCRRTVAAVSHTRLGASGARRTCSLSISLSAPLRCLALSSLHQRAQLALPPLVGRCAGNRAALVVKLHKLTQSLRKPMSRLRNACCRPA